MDKVEHDTMAIVVSHFSTTVKMKMLPRGFEPRSRARKAPMIGRTTPRELACIQTDGRQQDKPYEKDRLESAPIALQTKPLAEWYKTLIYVKYSQPKTGSTVNFFLG